MGFWDINVEICGCRIRKYSYSDALVIDSPTRWEYINADGETTMSFPVFEFFTVEDAKYAVALYLLKQASPIIKESSST